MNQADLVDELMAQGLSQTQARTALNTVIDTMRRGLRGGDDVVLRGFGKFSIGKRQAGVFNVQGKIVHAPEREFVRFKASPKLI